MKTLLLIIVVLLIILAGIASVGWYMGAWPISCDKWRDFANRAEFEKTPFMYKNCFK